MAEWNTDLVKRYDRPGPRYTSYPPATQFHEEITAEDVWQAVDEGNQAHRPLSLYVHIPFCNTVCYYCACNRIITASRARAADYLAVLKQEIKHKAAAIDSQRPVVQMHWGGGTPTFLDDSQLTELVYDLARHFNLLDDDRGDYAIEVDPRTVDRARLGLIRGLGFNRISLGVQDLDPRVQQAVNRVQSVEMISQLFDWCRDFGFRSINADLIYGLPWQSLTSLQRTLEQLIAMKPERISLYNYAHMPARFKMQRQIVERALPSANEKLLMLTMAGRQLELAGYRLIGMDHFALEHDSLAVAQDQGRLHRNFQGYTEHGDADLLGFGVSAISQLGNLYAQNHKQLSHWQNAILAQSLPLEGGYLLDRDDCLRRELIVRLLCDMCLDYRAFGQRWQLDFQHYFAAEMAELQHLQDDGLISRDNQWLMITERGRLLARAVVMVFDRYSRAYGDHRFSRII